MMPFPGVGIRLRGAVGGRFGSCSPPWPPAPSSSSDTVTLMTPLTGAESLFLSFTTREKVRV